MVCEGVLRGGVVELPGGVSLAEGTPVDVIVVPQAEARQAPKARPGSSQAVLEGLLRLRGKCSAEDVAALDEAIEAGKRPVNFRGVFDGDRETG